MICFRFFFRLCSLLCCHFHVGKKNWVSRIKKTIYLLSFHGICSIFILSWNEKEIKKNYTKTHSSLKTIEHVNNSTSASCATLTWRDAHNFTSEEIKFHYLSISNGEKMHGITEKGEHRTYVSYIFNCRRRSIVQSCCVFFCCCFFSPFEIRYFILWFSFRFDFVWNIMSISGCFVQSFRSLLCSILLLFQLRYRKIMAPLKVCLFWNISRYTSFDGILRFEVKKSYAVEKRVPDATAIIPMGWIYICVRCVHSFAIINIITRLAEWMDDWFRPFFHGTTIFPIN